jgi:hypothetical protein
MHCQSKSSLSSMSFRSGLSLHRERLPKVQNQSLQPPARRQQVARNLKNDQSRARLGVSQHLPGARVTGSLFVLLRAVKNYLASPTMLVSLYLRSRKFSLTRHGSSAMKVAQRSWILWSLLTIHITRRKTMVPVPTM